MIPERAILISTEPGDLVFDPFGGGGSTYQAAEKHHRNWIGSELYDCHHIAARLYETYPISFAGALQFNLSEVFRHEAQSSEVLRRRKRQSM